MKGQRVPTWSGQVPWREGVCSEGMKGHPAEEPREGHRWLEGTGEKVGGCRAGEEPWQQGLGGGSSAPQGVPSEAASSAGPTGTVSQVQCSNTNAIMSQKLPVLSLFFFH